MPRMSDEEYHQRTHLIEEHMREVFKGSAPDSTTWPLVRATLANTEALMLIADVMRENGRKWLPAGANTTAVTEGE